MPCAIKNPANIDLSTLEPHIQGMYDFFDQKIGFKRPPTMVKYMFTVMVAIQKIC